MRIGLVGCVKSKRDRPSPAKDLYTSTLFVGRRRYVERNCDEWFVLSALHGLVEPDQVIEPYDVSLAEAEETVRARWSAAVLAQLERQLGRLDGKTFEVHAGSAYRDHGLVAGLRAVGATVEEPAAGLNFGQQLAFYAVDGQRNPAAAGGYGAIGAALGGNGSPVTVSFGALEVGLGRTLPPSAHRHRPWWANSDQTPQGRGWLGAGWRVARVDLKGATVTFERATPRQKLPTPPPAVDEKSERVAQEVEVVRVERLGPFSYRWPEGIETFESGWEALTRDGRKVRMGFGRRTVFGADRVHAVVLVDGQPVVEGSAADDYAVTHTLASMVKRDRKDVVDQAALPPGYRGLPVVRHRDVIRGKGARQGLAVLLREDDVLGWARHALLRLEEKTGKPAVPTPDPGAAAAAAAAGEVPAPSPAVASRGPDSKQVVDALLDYGAAMAARPPGAPPAFTADPKANAFLASDPFAFLVAVICDQGIRAERAWAVPFELRRRLGHFDLQRMASAPHALRSAFAARPALHRLVNTMPTWVSLAASKVLSDYHGDAGAIWDDEPTAAELQARLRAFVGISQKKAAMATEILERDLGVVVHELEGSDVAFDVHLRRVFLRSGLAQRDDLEHMVKSARLARPDRPGSLDFPVWDVGRRWCRPTDPRCDECAIGAVCPRLVAAGNGVRGM